MLAFDFIVKGAFRLIKLPENSIAWIIHEPPDTRLSKLDVQKSPN